jgi:hypothetical protein
MTGVHPRKRLRDLISATKFREKHGLEFTPVMSWILTLLVEKREPELAVLSTHKSEEVAKRKFRSHHTRLIDTLLNDTVDRANSGKPVGTKDTPQGSLNKSISWRTTREARCAGMKGPWSPEAVMSYTIAQRANDGYPHPELARKHPLNVEHWKRVSLFGKFGKTSREHMTKAQLTRSVRRRELWGFPDPAKGMRDPVNVRRYHHLKEMGYNLRNYPTEDMT